MQLNYSLIRRNNNLLVSQSSIALRIRKMNYLIDAVLIDTSALESKQFDFLGIRGEIVPAFFDLIKQKGITLLSHPVLIGEMKKHILDSDLVKRSEELSITINRNEKIFELIGLVPEEIIDKLKNLSLGAKTIAAFEERYQDAIDLGFPSAASVFEDYFASKPPFGASTNKKKEFPDAFVLHALKQYVSANPALSVLVISGDNDWKETVSGVDRIMFVETVEKGIKFIQSSEGILSSFFSAEQEIKYAISTAAEDCFFELMEYDPIDFVEVHNVIVTKMYDDIVPLRITQTEAVIKFSAEISVAGTATVVDDDNTFYDPESDTILFLALATAHFKNAPADIDVEIKMLFDSDNPGKVARIERPIINYHNAIELDLEQADVDWESKFPEDDWQ